MKTPPSEPVGHVLVYMLEYHIHGCGNLLKGEVYRMRAKWAQEISDRSQGALRIIDEDEAIWIITMNQEEKARVGEVVH